MKNEYARLRANLAAVDALSGQTHEHFKATKILLQLASNAAKLQKQDDDLEIKTLTRWITNLVGDAANVSSRWLSFNDV